jgi:flavin-binding protein dodecin
LAPNPQTLLQLYRTASLDDAAPLNRSKTMATVAKVIEVSASSSKGLEDAIQGGLKKVAKTVKQIQGAWVNDIKVTTSPDGKVTEWRVNMRVTFMVQ